MVEIPEFLARLGAVEAVTEKQIAELEIGSGRVIACDPLVFLGQTEPFRRRVPAGRYPVVLALRDGEVAYAMLRFADAEVASWEPALCPGESLTDGVPGYPVDSGTGCFLDAEVAAAYNADRAERESKVADKVAESGVDPGDAEAWRTAHDRISEELAPWDELLQPLRATGYGRRRPWAAIELPEPAGGPLVAFKSGAGDGCYASYWGLDDDDQVVCLVTDFGLLSAGEEVEEEPELDDAGLAAALGFAVEPEPEPAAEASGGPIFNAAVALLRGLIGHGLLSVDDDEFSIEKTAEKMLVAIDKRGAGAIADVLMDQPGVDELFADDATLEQLAMVAFGGAQS